ncbi:unnamed protein product [Darwinula stevensoni]|uniref:Uncharacterized protein n=1 Tax=Darwinula stevensoni TaxID=69355 RepID=A0A7R9AE56_9CRUS|nr:unnamed protein product [Darwinula stevensoni]CAG0902044.1 unnamed protein product [Darwinula stevensoni]
MGEFSESIYQLQSHEPLVIVAYAIALQYAIIGNLEAEKDFLTLLIQHQADENKEEEQKEDQDMDSGRSKGGSATITTP